MTILQTILNIIFSSQDPVFNKKVETDSEYQGFKELSKQRPLRDGTCLRFLQRYKLSFETQPQQCNARNILLNAIINYPVLAEELLASKEFKQKFISELNPENYKELINYSQTLEDDELIKKFNQFIQKDPSILDALYEMLVDGIKNDDLELLSCLMQNEKVRTRANADFELVALCKMDSDVPGLLQQCKFSEYVDSTVETDDINQSILNDVLSEYLKSKGRDPSIILDTGGQCNGWVFLYQILRTQGKENEFFEMLNEIAACRWNVKKIKDGHLSSSCLREKYHSMEDLLEYTINQLVLFQATSDMYRQLSLGWFQHQREKQYDLVGDAALGRQLQSIYQINKMPYHLSSLTEMLELITSMPGTSVDLGISPTIGFGHAVTIYVTPEGKFDYYDPNNGSKLRSFSSAHELALLIQNSVANSLRAKFKAKNPNIDEEVQLHYDLHIYKFYNKNEKIPQFFQSTKNISPSLNESVNRYNPLHLAVFENNIQKFKEIVSHDPSLLKKKNVFGETPLLLACKLKNEKLIDAILYEAKKANIDIQIDQSDMDINEFLNDDQLKIVSRLMHQGYITPHGFDKNGFHLAPFLLLHDEEEGVKKIAELKLNLNQKDKNGIPLLIHLALHDYKNANNFKQLLAQSDCDLNERLNEMTALMFAAKSGNTDVVKILLEMGADATLVDTQGKSAKDLTNNGEIAKLIQYHISKIESNSPIAKKQPITHLKDIKRSDVGGVTSGSVTMTDILSSEKPKLSK